MVSDVMDLVAPLLNDNAKQKFTYQAQLPYFNIALQELQLALEVNEIGVTELTVANLHVVAGQTTAITANNTTTPNYPTDLIDIQQLWERLWGSNDPFVPMFKRDYLPHYLDNINTDTIVYWTWLNQEIQFISPTTDREIKMDYIRQYFANIVSTTTATIDVMNSRTFLMYRTAALCARFVGENPTRADALDMVAGNVDTGGGALGVLINLNVKSKQDVQTRRKPFMAGYKQRSTT